MSPSISTVIIDRDTASRKGIEGILKALDQVVVVGSAEDLAAGYDLVVRTRPMLVIMELDSEPKKALETMEKMLSHFPGLNIFATSKDSSSDNILRAIHGGATEFLLRPVDSQDLFNSLKKVGRLMVPRAEASVSEKGKIITCFSPKGGIGNTTLASNLAVCLHQATDKPVVLVDLDLESGDASMFLNLKTKYTISDVTANITRLDRAFLQTVLAKHPSGIYFLAEPQKIEEAGEITPNQVREVLELLKTMFAYVVVDTVDNYSGKNLAAFDVSDMVLVVGILSLPAIKNLQKALDVLEELGHGPDKVKLIINRYLRKGEISLEDAEKALNYKVFWHIPNDFNDVMTSINRGMPLTLLAPHSEITRAFRDMSRETLDYLSEMAGKAHI